MELTRLQKILDDHKLWLRDEGGCRANLRSADLSGADLSGANLRSANLSGADLRSADLSGADLSGANLRSANLRSADLSGANLRSADLSGAKNLLSAIHYIDAHFERTADGFVAFKMFGGERTPPASWVIKPGSVIEEVPNPDRGTTCGSGVNVAPIAWVRRHYGGEGKPIWKVLIRWEWLPGVVVPFGTDGRIRCERVELIEIVQ